MPYFCLIVPYFSLLYPYFFDVIISTLPLLFWCDHLYFTPTFYDVIISTLPLLFWCDHPYFTPTFLMWSSLLYPYFLWCDHLYFTPTFLMWSSLLYPYFFVRDQSQVWNSCIQFANICIWHCLACEMAFSQLKCLNSARTWKAGDGFGHKCRENRSRMTNDVKCNFLHASQHNNMLKGKLVLILTDRYYFACSAQQTLCLFNKLSCMYCNSHIMYMYRYTYFVFNLTINVIYVLWINDSGLFAWISLTVLSQTYFILLFFRIIT